MFGWLKRLFGKRSNDVGLDCVFNPAERMIYQYWDGTKIRSADPMVLYKRLMDVWPDLSVDIKVATSPLLKDKGKAHESVVKTLRGVFQIEPFDKGGLTELELAGLFEHFMLYGDQIKKNSSLYAMSSTGLGDTPASSEGVQATSNSSGSGSTAGGSSIGSPEPSPSVLPSEQGSSTQDSTTTKP